MASNDRADNSLSDAADASALDAATKSTLKPSQEYLLQGSILVEDVDKLLELLRGLCDNCEEEVEIFRDYEAVYSALMDQALKLRVRRSLLHLDQPTALRYVGLTELSSASDPTAVRSSVDVQATGDVVKFIEMTRFAKDFEYVASGYAFRKGRMRITVSRIIDATEKGNVIHEHRYISNSYLVEMSAIEPAGGSAVGAEMRQFADRLEPLVYMIKPKQLTFGLRFV